MRKFDVFHSTPGIFVCFVCFSIGGEVSVIGDPRVCVLFLSCVVPGVCVRYFKKKIVTQKLKLASKARTGSRVDALQFGETLLCVFWGG